MLISYSYLNSNLNYVTLQGMQNIASLLNIQFTCLHDFWQLLGQQDFLKNKLLNYLRLLQISSFYLRRNNC